MFLKIRFTLGKYIMAILNYEERLKRDKEHFKTKRFLDSFFIKKLNLKS